MPIDPMDKLVMTFPNREEFTINLAFIQQHRAAHYRREEPNAQWWRDPMNAQLEAWARNHMKWSQLGHHVTPEPGRRRDGYYARQWREGTVATSIVAS